MQQDNGHFVEFGIPVGFFLARPQVQGKVRGPSVEELYSERSRAVDRRTSNLILDSVQVTQS